MRRLALGVVLGGALWTSALLGGCSTQAAETNGSGETSVADGPGRGSDDPVPAARSVPVYGYEIVATYPHDRASYTQGLLYHEGHLYESTGRNGESTLRKYVPETGRVVLRHDLAYELFAEGLARYKGVLIQLTWENGVAIVYDMRSFAEVNRFEYEGEGWGLAFDGEHLVMSDSTDVLTFRDPKTFEVVRKLPVTFWREDLQRDVALIELNELEVIDGEIWANVYQDERIARIDPETGKVTSLVDFTGLQEEQGVSDKIQDVLNGIAYDAENDRIFITGKYWPNLYHVRVVGEDE